MKLELFRHLEWSSERSTIGEWYTNGIYECFTLELPKLFNGVENVHDKCCIPCGTYPVDLYDSPKHKCIVPIIKNVPNRADIEVHIANKPEDLLGCIGVGKTHSTDWIGGSKSAFDTLLPEIKDAKERGEEITITITEEAVK